MSNQEKRQQSVRAVTGTAYTYNEDWLALFASAGITAGTVDDRMLAWCNAQLSSSYTHVDDAMRAFAVSKGANSWDELGTFTLTNPDLLNGDGAFNSATNWILGSGHTISGGVLNDDGSSANTLSQHSASGTLGVSYVCEYTIARTSGTMRMRIGDSTIGVSRTASGTYSETLTVVVAGGNFRIQTFNFVGTVDNLTIRQA